jgi:hypothetical protein
VPRDTRFLHTDRLVMSQPARAEAAAAAAAAAVGGGAPTGIPDALLERMMDRKLVRWIALCVHCVLGVLCVRVCASVSSLCPAVGLLD